MGSLTHVRSLVTEIKSLGVFLCIEHGKLLVKARPGTLTDLLKAEIAEHKVAIMSCLKAEILLVDHWQQLAASSLTDMDVIGLDDALFLFAYRMIQNAGQTELAGIWKQYSPFWKKRQSREAYHVVERLYESRSKSECGARE